MADMLYCGKCGRGIGERQTYPYCGGRGQAEPPVDVYTFTNPYRIKRERPIPPDAKSRITAGLLQIFTGMLGLGRFYLGYTKIALAQIGVSIVTCGFGGMIWGIIDGILILSGKIRQDGKGKKLAP